MKIDPSYLAEIAALSFRIKRKVFGKYAGDEKTASSGDGLTFKDHSQYVIGDDVRKIDWKVFARTQELYVKRYEADRNLTMHSLLDASASMDYGDGDEHKFHHASKLALGLAYMFTKHQGRVRFATFAEDIHQAQNISGTATVQSMLKTLEITKVEGKTDILRSSEMYKQRYIKGKSSIVLFSDMLISVEDFRRLCRVFPRTRIVIAHICHPNELNVKYKGDYNLIDAETTSRLAVHVSPKLIKEYQQMHSEFRKNIETLCEQYNHQYVLIDTSKSVVENSMRLWEFL